MIMIPFLGIVSFAGLIWGLVALVRGRAGLIVGRSKAAKVAGACLAVMLFLIAIDPNKAKPTPPAAAQPTPPAAAQPTPPAAAAAPPAAAEPANIPKQQAPAAPAPQPLKDYIASVVNKVAGPTSTLDGHPARIRKEGIDLNLLPNGTATQAIVPMWVNDSLSHDMMRVGILDDSTRIFRQVFTERQDAPEKLILEWYAPGQDVKGNSVDLTLASITMTKANAATFNWQNFRYTKLPQAADDYIEHPALSK